DPSDRVRAAVVGLAAAAGPTGIATLIPLLAGRRWPLAQEAVLRELPALLAGDLPTRFDLESILSAVGSLDPPPLPSERPGLEALARRIGRERLLPDLGAAETRRVGAAWMLVLEGRTASLAAIAAMTEDEAERVRDLAVRAGNLLAKNS